MLLSEASLTHEEHYSSESWLHFQTVVVVSFCASGVWYTHAYTKPFVESEDVSNLTTIRKGTQGDVKL